MYQLPPNTLMQLIDSKGPEAIQSGRRGIEKESLRIDRHTGALAKSAHPTALGAALTHPFITTDYSEALLEFVTPALNSNDAAMQFLRDVHKFTYTHIPGEMLWPCSMPCGFSDHSDVPLAQYGDSHVGQMKTIYRRGLGERYGRIMQTISGVHFNYSLPSTLWPSLQDLLHGSPCERLSPQAFQSAAYFALIRNFKRVSWLVLYLFGASPAVCKSFFQDQEIGLEQKPCNTAVGEYATSLRMSDIGYSNNAQSGLNISVNSLDEYVAGLARAISTPFAEYEKIGLFDGEKRLQISTNVLQIANEYYSVVRPKRVAHSGEEPTTALRDRGVEYVEIRALDLDPFSAIGVNADELDFLECLLIHCLFSSSPVISAKEQVAINANDNLVAKQGRQPGLTLSRNSESIALNDWANEICLHLGKIAEMLDAGLDAPHYVEAIAKQQAAIADPSKTPSAQLLEALSRGGLTYIDFGLSRAQSLAQEFEQQITITSAVNAELESLARESLVKAAQTKAADEGTLEDYLAGYFGD